jgi:hypothetical protein
MWLSVHACVSLVPPRRALPRTLPRRYCVRCYTPRRAGCYARLLRGLLRTYHFPRMCAMSYRNLAKQPLAALTLRLALCDFA